MAEYLDFESDEIELSDLQSDDVIAEGTQVNQNDKTNSGGKVKLVLDRNEINALSQEDDYLTIEGAVAELMSEEFLQANIGTVSADSEEIIHDTDFSLAAVVAQSSELLPLEAEDGTDLVTLENFRNQLYNDGYDYVDSKDYDELILISERQDLLADPQKVSRSIDFILNDCKTAVTVLRNTINCCGNSGSDVITQSSLELKNVIAPGCLSNSDTQLVRYKVWEILTNYNIEDEEVSYVAYNELSASDRSLAKALQADPDATFEYVDTVTRILKTNRDRNRRAAEKHETMQKKTTARLLKDTVNNAKLIQDARRENQLQFLKKFIQRDERLYAVCPSCGREKDVTKISPIECNIFPSEIGNLKILPVPYECECGTVFMLTSEEYDIIRDSLKDKITSGIKAFESNSKEFSKGTRFVSYTPPIREIYASIGHLMTTDSGETFDSTEVITKPKEEAVDGVDAINMNEYLVALREFNQKMINLGNKVFHYDNTELKKLSPESLDDKIYKFANEKGRNNYQEIAFFIAESTSRSYIELKKQALFSFINEIKDNHLLFTAIDNNEIERIKNIIILLNKTDKFNPELLSNDVIVDLTVAIFDNKSDHTITLADGTILKSEGSVEYREELLKLARVKALPKYEKLLLEKKEKQAETVERLKELSELFGFIKIARNGNMLLSDLHSIIFNEQMESLVHEITDRMIISNLAEDFFKIWSGFGNETIHNAGRTLTNLSTAKKIEKLTNAFRELTLEDDVSTYIQSSGMVCRMSTAMHLEPLSRITKALKQIDFFNFCQEISKINSTDFVLQKSWMSLKVKAPLDYLKEMASREFESIDNLGDDHTLNYYKYYLSEFTTEEILSAEVDYSNYSFGRFIPFRKDGEALDEFLARYEELGANGELNCVNSMDYCEKFNKIGNHLALISCWGLLSEIKYNNFLNAAFTCVLVDFAVKVKHPLTGRKVLGISDTILNSINRKLYTPKLYTDDTSKYAAVLSYCYSDLLSTEMVGAFNRYTTLTVSDEIDVIKLLKRYPIEKLTDSALNKVDPDYFNDALSEIEYVFGLKGVSKEARDACSSVGECA